MTTTAHQQRPSRTELGRCLMESGTLTSDWAPTFTAVDRAAFLPPLMWPFLPGGEAAVAQAVTVDRRTDPAAWYEYADSDLPIVTQWDDGDHRGTDPGRVATSSSSQPTVVFQLLAALDADTGMRVQDAGTGTGETAGLLAHRCGAENVVTIDVDQAVSAAARERLCRLGLYAEVLTGDALVGHPGGGLYDRVLCTFGVRSIPRAWMDQLRPGGVIAVPYGTHYSNRDALLRLTAYGDGTASGRFRAGIEFMRARAHRTVWPAHEDYVTTWPGSTGTAVQPDQLADSDAEFVIGLAVPHITHTVFRAEDGTRAAWFYSRSDRSWAAVCWPEQDRPGIVYQHGPRRLWDAVEAACTWWEEQGRPGIDSFGLTVTPHGETPWLDEPGNLLPGAQWR